MKIAYCLLAAMTLGVTSYAQKGSDGVNEKMQKTISIGTDGVRIEDGNKKVKKDKAIDVTFASLDVGINNLQDNSLYTSVAAKNFLQVPQTMQNSNLFDLRTGKSINVNLWPVLGKGRILKTSNQKIYLSTGVGLQVYNFRYTNPVKYVNNPAPYVGLDSISFRKDKLVVTYLSVPLQFTFKTRMVDKLWLVYGVGITGGYRISSYTKQVSDQRGKDKNPGNFNLNNFNSTVTAEFGLDHYFRLYASYQLTNMYNDATGLDQHPFCIGLRFGGI